jgi:hypothetical protein
MFYRERATVYMKRILKVLFLTWALMILAVLPAQTALAGSNTPGNVKKLTAKAVSETSIQLTWSKVSGATGYYVFRVNGTSLKKVATTSKTTYTLKNLSSETTYSYQVFAYKKSGSKTYQSASGSPTTKTKLSVYTPGKTTQLKVISYGNKAFLLGWAKAKNATGYIIYQYDESSQSYKEIGTTTDVQYQVSGLTAGTQYKFKVQAYRTVKSITKTGTESNVVTATAKTVDLGDIHARYYTATVNKTMTVSVLNSKKKVTLKKGTKVTATSKHTDVNVTAIMKNGTKVRILGKYLTYGNLSWSKTYYTQNQKENWVNYKGYSSSSDYLIWVSQYTCNITIFKGSQGNWKQILSEPCVIGGYGKTPPGTFKILKKSTKYGGPIIYFTWSYSKEAGNGFHKRIDEKTRAAVSNGCVRLSDYALYFINDRCPIGTTVVSY